MTMWNLRSLAECVLAAPQDGGVNVGLARDLARAALAADEALRGLIGCFDEEWIAAHSFPGTVKAFANARAALAGGTPQQGQAQADSGDAASAVVAEEARNV